ncbi:MAG: hypothetical protein VCF25_00385 [Candidatus Poribacteria bacterium]
MQNKKIRVIAFQVGDECQKLEGYAKNNTSATVVHTVSDNFQAEKNRCQNSVT